MRHHRVDETNRHPNVLNLKEVKANGKRRPSLGGKSIDKTTT